jgi:general secretion pathway protein M
MGIQERMDALQPRERRMLAVFVGLFVVVAVLLIPIAVSATLADERETNEQLHATIDRLFAERDDIEARNEENQKVLDRYQKPAPALAGFLDRNAKANELDIPQFKDRPMVPQGKRYEEHSTEISVKKVGMRNLILFMESIASADFPASITRFSLRKRGTEPDSWDATMVVSAYHRKAEPTTKSKADEGAEGTTDDEEQQRKEEEE